MQSPQVELVRGAGVQSVDGIAAVANARQRDEDVVRVGIGGGEATQCRRYAGRRMTAEYAHLADVPRVPSIPGDGVGGVAEPIVVVLDRNHWCRAREMDLSCDP